MPLAQGTKEVQLNKRKNQKRGLKWLRPSACYYVLLSEIDYFINLFSEKSMFCPIATWTPGSLSPLPTRKAEKRDLWSRLTQSYSILSCLTSFQVTTDNEAEFFISLHGAGDGELKVYGEAPYGHFPVDLLQSPKEKDTYIVRYTPRGVGEHKIHINFAGEPVKGSPYIVKVRHSKHARRSLVCSPRPVPSRPVPVLWKFRNPQL